MSCESGTHNVMVSAVAVARSGAPTYPRGNSSRCMSSNSLQSPQGLTAITQQSNVSMQYFRTNRMPSRRQSRDVTSNHVICVLVRYPQLLLQRGIKRPTRPSRRLQCEFRAFRLERYQLKYACRHSNPMILSSVGVNLRLLMENAQLHTKHIVTSDVRVAEMQSTL